MPSAGKSDDGKRRSVRLFAILAAPARRDCSKSDRLSRKRRRADSARNQSRHLSFSRRMARFSRKKTDGHLSPRILAAKPERQRRSLEGFPKSHARPRPASQKGPPSGEALQFILGIFLVRLSGP